MSSQLSRKLISAAKALKNIVWDVRSKEDVSAFKTSVETKIGDSPALSKNVYKVTVDGDPHESKKRDGTVDPIHISGRLLTNSDKRLTSYHAYGDGRVVFSQNKYNIKNPITEGFTTSSFQTGLTWQMGQNNTCAMWWDGAEWQFGQWSDKHGLWIAYHKGQWHAWQ